jgi:hypothetical protein
MEQQLDIQVPDPEISFPSPLPEDQERTATGLSRASQ